MDMLVKLILIISVGALPTLGTPEADAFQVSPIYQTSDNQENEGIVFSAGTDNVDVSNNSPGSFIEIESDANEQSEIQPSSNDEGPEGRTEYNEYEAYEDDQEDDQQDETTTKTNRLRFTERKSAISSFKERLKERFQKAKEAERRTSLSSSRTRTQTRESPSRFATRFSKDEATEDVEEEEARTESPSSGRTGRTSFRSRISSRTRGRHQETSLENEEEEQDSYGSRSYTSRRRNSGSSSHSSYSSSRSKTRDRNTYKPSAPKLNIGSSYSSRDSGSSRYSSSRDRSPIAEDSDSLKEEIRPTASQKSSSKTSAVTSLPKVEFKKFNPFERPDYRKAIRSNFFKKKKQEKDASAEVESDDENEEDNDEVEGDHDSAPSALVPSIIDDEDLLQSIDNDEIRLQRLMTTLEVSTQHPNPNAKSYLEVATIRSPYTFEIENNDKSTRFITVTRTYTRNPEEEETESEIEITATPTIEPSTSTITTPLFDTKSIPPPENILASTPSANYFTDIGQGGFSGDIETLAPIVLPSSLYEETPPLKTVTETFSTVEMMLKRSVLPIIIGSDTSYETLSQSYSVTRYVTAVKTIPPMELYEFSPDQSFKDFDALFEGAGSENRETLLPGELEFSDQDNFGLEGASPIRVTPPPGFLDDLDLIGAKHDFVHHMEKEHNPEILQLKSGSVPKLESSLSDFSFGDPRDVISPTRTQSIPSIQSLGGLGITPEQLLYLQLLQNPLAAFGLGGQPQVVTESIPVLNTKTVYETSTIKLNFGAKEYFTTLTTAIGITTVTDYKYSTKTVAPGLGGLPVVNPLAGLGSLPVEEKNSPVVNTPIAAGIFGPSFTVISSPVVRDTVKTETMTQEIKVTFRNVPTLTTITSTSLVSTQITSYVTKTQKVLPTINPLAGLLG